MAEPAQESPTQTRALTLFCHGRSSGFLSCLSGCNWHLLLCLNFEFLKPSPSSDVCNLCFRPRSFLLEPGARKSGLSSRNLSIGFKVQGSWSRFCTDRVQKDQGSLESGRVILPSICLISCMKWVKLMYTEFHL